MCDDEGLWSTGAGDIIFISGLWTLALKQLLLFKAHNEIKDIFSGNNSQNEIIGVWNINSPCVILLFLKIHGGSAVLWCHVPGRACTVWLVKTTNLWYQPSDEEVTSVLLNIWHRLSFTNKRFLDLGRSLTGKHTFLSTRQTNCLNMYVKFCLVLGMERIHLFFNLKNS